MKAATQKAIRSGVRSMPIPVPVSSYLCVAHETELVKRNSVFSSAWSIADEQGSLLFRFSWNNQRTIHNAVSGEVLLLMKKENERCPSSPWIASRGESKSESQLHFTARQKRFSRGSWFRNPSHDYEVFLPGNNDASSPDFSIKTNSRGSSGFSILSQGRPIAEAKITRSGHECTIKVYPEADREIIAASKIN